MSFKIAQAPILSTFLTLTASILGWNYWRKEHRESKETKQKQMLINPYMEEVGRRNQWTSQRRGRWNGRETCMLQCCQWEDWKKGPGW